MLICLYCSFVSGKQRGYLKNNLSITIFFSILHWHFNTTLQINISTMFVNGPLFTDISQQDQYRAAWALFLHKKWINQLCINQTLRDDLPSLPQSLSLAPLMLIKQTLSHICSCYHNAVNNETFLSDFVSAFIFPPRNMISLSVMSFIWLTLNTQLSHLCCMPDSYKTNRTWLQYQSCLWLLCMFIRNNSDFGYRWCGILV